MKIATCIADAERRLKAAGVDNPHLDARILAAHALRLDRAQLLSQSDRVLNEDEARGIEKLVARRAAREPVARILGSREFWGLSFDLNEATLVPRPESETLVEVACATITKCHPRESGDPSSAASAADKSHLACGRSPVDSRFRGNDKLRILDLGTGSGCLLLALLHEIPSAAGLGIDASPRAVEQARINAENLGLSARAEFRAGDWANGIAETFDLIISNPPYVAQGDIAGLMPEVRDHDPALALDGGADGLDVYRLLIPQLPKLLKAGGAAIVEIGIGQPEAVSDLFHAAGFTKTETHKDLNDIERCVVAHIP